MSGDQTVGSGFNEAGSYNHALLWTATGVVDLNPTNLGVSYSIASATEGNQQVGYGVGTGNNYHALLWTGTSASVVDLNPTNLGFVSSLAYGTNDSQQVGCGATSGNPNNPVALLWNGTAASAVNLNPTNLSGFTESGAYATNGTQQVGYAYGPGKEDAMLWNGTAASAVDLNPTKLGITNSFAYGTSGTQQVGAGWGYNEFTGESFGGAMLWTGTAASAVDLNPTNLSGIDDSEALATNGTQQVGFGYNDYNVWGGSCALLWSGTAASVVDLQTLLPSTGTWTSSSADLIDSSGNVYGWASGTFDNVTGTFAVEWSVPEPATASMLLIAGAGILMRRRRR
ncbi:MAG: PEP-CTERM sorting domain-containing protein [Tepidisphaeraceae bacterium]|jgi:hypothetical protein